MTDTVRWCFTHKAQQAIVGACEACFNSGGYMKWMADECEIVTMVRADQPVYRIDLNGYATDVLRGEAYRAFDEMIDAGVLVRLGKEGK